MSDIKLTKSELAALDLLIENMQSERLAVGAVEARFTPAIVRVTRVLLKVTPVIAEAVGVTAKQEAVGEKLQESARDITSGVSLDTLLELRRKATGQD
jgi:hypothetical protein